MENCTVTNLGDNLAGRASAYTGDDVLGNTNTETSLEYFKSFREKYNGLLSQERIPTEKARNPWDEMGAYFMKPSQIKGVGHARVTMYKSLLADWYKEAHGLDNTAMKSLYDEMVGKYASAELSTVGMENPHVQRYLQNIQSGQYLGFQDSSDFYTRTLSTTSKNLMANSPKVALLNGFELSKLIAHYGHHGIKGIGQAIARTEARPWKRLPELEQEGVYGYELSAGRENGFSIVALTDTIMRNAAWFAGESAHGAGGGHAALEDAAYIVHPMDMPQVYANPLGRTATTLARYTTEEARQLARAVYSLKNAAMGRKQEGDLPVSQATGALVGMTLARAIAGGVTASLPFGLYEQLPGEAKALLDQWNEALPLDLVNKTTGIDISSSVTNNIPQPFIMQRIIQRDLSYIGNAVQALYESTVTGDWIGTVSSSADLAIASAQVGYGANLKNFPIAQRFADVTGDAFVNAWLRELKSSIMEVGTGSIERQAGDAFGKVMERRFPKAGAQADKKQD